MNNIDKSNIDNFSNVKFNSLNLEEVIRYFDAPKEERIAMICPVRNITEDQKKEIDTYIDEKRESKKPIYCPIYHTDQNDDIGLTICRTNGTAIMNAGRIDYYFDPTSNGSWFDFGMAYMADVKFNCINPSYFDSMKNELIESDKPKPKKSWLGEFISNIRYGTEELKISEDAKLERFIAYHSEIIPLITQKEFESKHLFSLRGKDLQNYRNIEYQKFMMIHNLKNDNQQGNHIIQAVPADRMSYFRFGMIFMDNLKNNTPIVLGSTAFNTLEPTPKKSFQNVLLELEKQYDGSHMRWYMQSLEPYEYHGGLC